MVIHLDSGHSIKFLTLGHSCLDTSLSYVQGAWKSSIWNPIIYNIIRWFACPMRQTTRQPSAWHFKYFSFQLRALKSLYFHFCNFIKKMKKKEIERVFAKNTWNIRRLVDELFVPTAQQTSVLFVDWQISGGSAPYFEGIMYSG